jgi:hypothetical protein
VNWSIPCMCAVCRSLLHVCCPGCCCSTADVHRSSSQRAYPELECQRSLAVLLQLARTQLQSECTCPCQTCTKSSVIIRIMGAVASKCSGDAAYNVLQQGSVPARQCHSFKFMCFCIVHALTAQLQKASPVVPAAVSADWLGHSRGVEDHRECLQAAQ